MKTLLSGIVLIILVGVGGLVYRNALEYSARPVACPLDALLCPDGTAVGRTGPACVFPACPPPNVSLADTGIAFAVSEGFVQAELPDAASVIAYDLPATASSTAANVVIRQYPITASSTALSTIQQTAVSRASGKPVGATAYSSTALGGRTFTIVALDRSEGVIITAYYLARAADVLRFDAIDAGVPNWAGSNLDISTLPANAALRKLLSTLQVK